MTQPPQPPEKSCPRTGMPITLSADRLIPAQPGQREQQVLAAALLGKLVTQALQEIREILGSPELQVRVAQAQQARRERTETLVLPETRARALRAIQEGPARQLTQEQQALPERSAALGLQDRLRTLDRRVQQEPKAILETPDKLPILGQLDRPARLAGQGQPGKRLIPDRPGQQVLSVGQERPGSPVEPALRAIRERDRQAAQALQDLLEARVFSSSSL